MLVAQSNHQVVVNWTASSTTGVTYTVNKGTASGQESSYQSGLSAMSFTDTAVQAGTTYFYTITAVCGSGCPTGYAGSSKPSSEVSATVPTNAPAPPTGLTATAQ